MLIIFDHHSPSDSSRGETKSEKLAEHTFVHRCPPWPLIRFLLYILNQHLWHHLIIARPWHMYYFPCKIFRKGQTDSFKAGLCVIMEPLLIPTGHPRFARNASALASSSLYTMMLMLFMMGIETRSCEASGNLDWAALQEFGLTLIGFHYHHHPHHPRHPHHPHRPNPHNHPHHLHYCWIYCWELLYICNYFI